MSSPKVPKPQKISDVSPFDITQARRSDKQVAYAQDLEAVKLARQRGRGATILGMGGSPQLSETDLVASEKAIMDKQEADINMQKDEWSVKRALEDANLTADAIKDQASKQRTARLKGGARALQTFELARQKYRASLDEVK